MATNIQVERGGTFEDISYSSFSIEVPTSELAVAPTASVTTTVREDISANQNLRIVIDGTTRFDGQTESGGTKRTRGQVQLSAVHPADALFAEQVTFTEEPAVGDPDADQVLQAALDASNNGSNFTLDWSGSDVQLNSTYEVENRRLSDVFRDMCDRTSRVWWVDPGGMTIHVEPTGGRGTWQTLDGQMDGVTVQSFDEGSVKTVRNDVTVNATAGENVTGTDSDSTSISEFGRRSEKVNISYADTQAEADAYATELLIPDPLAQGEVLVPQRVGDITQPLANYTIDLTDEGKGIDATGLVIEKQTLEQGRATIQVGEGSGVSMANVNRNVKSRDDENPPGTVMPEERIGDDAVSETKLVDTAVTEEKLADLAVSLQKVQDGAIDTVKIQDNAIEAPKILAGEIVAEKLDTSLTRAQRLLAGEIEAVDIASDTITANEIQTLELETAELVIGTDADDQLSFSATDESGLTYLDIDPTGSLVRLGEDEPFVFMRASQMRAGQYIVENGVQALNDNDANIGDSNVAFANVYAHNINELTPEPIESVDLSALTGYDWHNPPAVATQRKVDDGEYCRKNPKKEGIELGHMSNYLFEICKAQQSELEAQDERINDLEERLDALEQGND